MKKKREKKASNVCVAKPKSNIIPHLNRTTIPDNGPMKLLKGSNCTQTIQIFVLKQNPKTGYNIIFSVRFFFVGFRMFRQLV